MKKHDEVFRPRVSVFDFTLITMRISGELRDLEPLVSLFDPRLRGYRDFLIITRMVIA